MAGLVSTFMREGSMNIPLAIDPQRVNAAETRHQITYLAIDKFKPNLDNPRTHSPAQIRKLARSMRAHGFITPVVVDPNHMVVACACRKSNPNILVVQPAEDRAAKNGPG